EAGGDDLSPDQAGRESPTSPLAAAAKPARRVTKRSSPEAEHSSMGHDLIDETPRIDRARTRALKAAVSGGPSSVVTDRLRHKLRTKQHLSSYTFRFRPE